MSIFFDHIDVLSTHPRNDTGKAMYTGKALVKFIDFEILESVVYDTSEIKDKMSINVVDEGQKKDLAVSELLIDFEVKSEEMQKQDNFYTYRFDGCTSIKDADFGYWIIKCKTLIIEWDEFVGNAWFGGR